MRAQNNGIWVCVPGAMLWHLPLKLLDIGLTGPRFNTAFSGALNDFGPTVFMRRLANRPPPLNMKRRQPVTGNSAQKQKK